MKTLLRRINWRLILIHFIAIWLFMEAFRLFASLYDYKFIHALRYAASNSHHIYEGFNKLNQLYPNTNLAVRLAEDVVRLTLMQFWGLIGAFLVSLSITLKMRWFWLNSVIAFAAGLVIFLLRKTVSGKFNLIYYISYVEYIFPKSLKLNWQNGATVFIALVIAIILLFSPFMIKLIEKGIYRQIIVHSTFSESDETQNRSESHNS
jgi:hypothetical protein